MVRSKSSDFGVGVAAKFCHSFARFGGKPSDLNKVAQSDILAKLLIALARDQVVVALPTVFKIDRQTPFDVRRVWADRSFPLEVFSEDPRCSNLNEVDVSRVRLMDTLRAGETFVSWEERFGRHATADYIPLGLNALGFFLENPHFIPNRWLPHQGGPNIIFFDGTLLVNSRGTDRRKCVCGMSWDTEEKAWVSHCFDEVEWKMDPQMWTKSYPSAVLVPA